MLPACFFRHLLELLLQGLHLHLVAGGIGGPGFLFHFLAFAGYRLGDGVVLVPKFLRLAAALDFDAVFPGKDGVFRIFQH